MGFFFRKSTALGPLRFNFSKSGIGMSAGVRGLRVGAGPLGNYVHMGRHGVYYRASLAAGTTRSRAVPAATAPVPPAESLQDIDSAATAELTDSTAAELLAEFERKRRIVPLAPLVGWIGGAITIAVALGGGGSAALLLGVATMVAYWLLRQRDRSVKTVVITYDLEPDAAAVYQRLGEALAGLADCAALWHVEAKGAVREAKRHAGASTVAQRKRVRLDATLPRYVETNVPVTTLPAGRQRLCFFPDRLLVFDRSGVGAIAYASLHIERQSIQFIERGSVPRDARVVGKTWQFVNKNGGPDRRFKNNSELPVVQYEQLHLTSESGLNEMFQLSRLDAGQPLETLVPTMADSLDPLVPQAAQEARP